MMTSQGSCCEIMAGREKRKKNLKVQELEKLFEIYQTVRFLC